MDTVIRALVWLKGFIWRVVVRPALPKNVDDAMRIFRRVAEELDMIEEEQKREFDFRDAEIFRQRDKRDSAMREIKRAQKSKQKVRELVDSPDD